jgi:hypothetical protein
MGGGSVSLKLRAEEEAGSPGKHKHPSLLESQPTGVLGDGGFRS